MTRHLKQFDVRRYGAKASYVDASGVGRDNLAAFQACADDMSASGGGDMLIPNARYGYWCSGPVTFTSSYCRVRNEGVVRWEPDAPGSLFRWEATTDTTVFNCGIEGGQIRGHWTSDPGAGTRYAKRAIEPVGTSNFFIRDVLVNDLISTTGANPSVAVWNRGKELLRMSGCLLSADRPVWIGANPKERSGPAGPIDSDHSHYHSNDYRPSLVGATFDDEAAIHVDPDLNVLNLIVDGNNNVAGGSSIFYWDDPSGGALHVDSVGLVLSGIRAEQQQGSKANIHISRRGVAPAFGIVLDKIALGMATVGINLEGTQSSVIRDCTYRRNEAQDTSPMALVLAASCTETVVQRFEVPRVPGLGPAVPLYDIGALVPYDNDGTALTWPKASGVSQFYDYQRFS